MGWAENLINWAFLPDSALDVAGWGFWFGLLGLLLSLVGFAITFRQLAKTKDASEAARVAVERIRNSLAVFDGANEASRASYALGTTLTHVRNGMWRDAADSYADVRRSLMRLRSIEYVALSHQPDIDEAMNFIARLCDRIEAQKSKGSFSIDVAKTCSIIRDHDELLVHIQESIKKAMI